MSRIERTLSAIAARGGKSLIPYITAGDPHPDRSVALMHAMVEAGADLIELGVPFSDPMADGPVIQLACERALAAGTTLAGVIAIVAEFRKQDARTPVVLMGYLNPIERMGVRNFAQRASAAGVDGVLIVDMAIEEAPDFAPDLRSAGLDCIFLLSPTTEPARVAAIAQIASGYLYYVSLKGVTGSKRIDTRDVALKLAEIRRHTRLPVAVGFGVRDAATAAEVASVADGVVVGSALVDEIARHSGSADGLSAILGAKIAELRCALDGVSERLKASAGR